MLLFWFSSFPVLYCGCSELVSLTLASSSSTLSWFCFTSFFLKECLPLQHCLLKNWKCSFDCWSVALLALTVDRSATTPVLAQLQSLAVVSGSQGLGLLSLGICSPWSWRPFALFFVCCCSHLTVVSVLRFCYFFAVFCLTSLWWCSVSDFLKLSILCCFVFFPSLSDNWNQKT